MRRGLARVIKAANGPARSLAGRLVAGGIAATLMMSCREATASAIPYRFAIDFPDSVQVANGVGIKLALSRDGSQLAVVGMKEGRKALYLRKSDDTQARLIAGTDSAFNPGFSPDGQWLHFQSGARLMKVRAVGGAPPQPVVDSVMSASWGDDGFILYDAGRALYRIGAAGGEKRRVAAPDASQGHRRYSWPEVLPGSKHALITIWRGSNSLDSARLGIVALSDGRVTDLGIRGANAHYAAPGYIVFARSGGAVLAIPFSRRKLAVTGPEAPLLQNVWNGAGGGTDFSVSDNGTLAYHGGVPEAEEMTMVAVNREGNARALPLLGRQRFSEPRISPDGRHMAVAIGPPVPSDTGDVWVYELATGSRTQLSASGVNIRPEWTRDGARVAYISRVRDSQVVESRRWDGTGAPTVLARGKTPAFYELAMGQPGGWSAVRTGLAPGGSAISIAPGDSFSAQRLLETKERVVLTPKISPNGRLIAYVATVAGRRELFVSPLPGPGQQIAVTTDGGTEPVWSPDGKTLYYRGLTNIMAAPVVERPTLSILPAAALFADTFKLSVAHGGYDIFPNGREFLMLAGWGRAQGNAYVLVNWMQTMGKK